MGLYNGNNPNARFNSRDNWDIGGDYQVNTYNAPRVVYQGNATHNQNTINGSVQTVQNYGGGGGGQGQLPPEGQAALAMLPPDIRRLALQHMEGRLPNGPPSGAGWLSSNGAISTWASGANPRPPPPTQSRGTLQNPYHSAPMTREPEAQLDRPRPSYAPPPQEYSAYPQGFPRQSGAVSPANQYSPPTHDHRRGPSQNPYPLAPMTGEPPRQSYAPQYPAPPQSTSNQYYQGDNQAYAQNSPSLQHSTTAQSTSNQYYQGDRHAASPRASIPEDPEYPPSRQAYTPQPPPLQQHTEDYATHAQNASNQYQRDQREVPPTRASAAADNPDYEPPRQPYAPRPPAPQQTQEYPTHPQSTSGYYQNEPAAPRHSSNNPFRQPPMQPRPEPPQQMYQPPPPPMTYTDSEDSSRSSQSHLAPAPSPPQTYYQPPPPASVANAEQRVSGALDFRSEERSRSAEPPQQMYQPPPLPPVAYTHSEDSSQSSQPRLAPAQIPPPPQTFYQPPPAAPVGIANVEQRMGALDPSSDSRPRSEPPQQMYQPPSPPPIAYSQDSSRSSQSHPAPAPSPPQTYYQPSPAAPAGVQANVEQWMSALDPSAERSRPEPPQQMHQPPSSPPPVAYTQSQNPSQSSQSHLAPAPALDPPPPQTYHQPPLAAAPAGVANVEQQMNALNLSPERSLQQGTSNANAATQGSGDGDDDSSVRAGVPVVKKKKEKRRSIMFAWIKRR